MPRNWGYANALIAAALFGASITFNKITLNDVHPLVAAGLIYFSAGILLSLIGFFSLHKKIPEQFGVCAENKPLKISDLPYLAAVTLSGAVIGPLLFLYGLGMSSAVNASLLLNTEVLFTVLIAFLFLKERAQGKGYFAMLLLFVSAAVITTNLDFSGLDFTGKLLGNLLILGGTLFWAIDNSLSKKLSMGNDAIKIAAFKSLVGGAIVLLAAMVLQMPFNISLATIPCLSFAGFFGVGISLILFLSALRSIGSMKTVVIYSSSALFGAISAFIVLGEPLSAAQMIAGAIMIYAIYLMSKR